MSTDHTCTMPIMLLMCDTIVCMWTQNMQSFHLIVFVFVFTFVVFIYRWTHSAIVRTLFIPHLSDVDNLQVHILYLIGTHLIQLRYFLQDHWTFEANINKICINYGVAFDLSQNEHGRTFIYIIIIILVGFWV